MIEEVTYEQGNKMFQVYAEIDRAGFPIIAIQKILSGDLVLDDFEKIEIEVGDYYNESLKSGEILEFACLIVKEVPDPQDNYYDYYFSIKEVLNQHITEQAK